LIFTKENEDKIRRTKVLMEKASSFTDRNSPPINEIYDAITIGEDISDKIDKCQADIFEKRNMQGPHVVK
jgi:hypothetical protein